MKCINCGVEIKSEYKNCPFCGKNIQIVPDYNVYDDDDFTVIAESAKSVVNNANVNKKPELTKEQKEARAKAKAKAVEEAKKRKTIITIVAIAIVCIFIIIAGIAGKTAIDKNNETSFDYQLRLADSARIKGDYETAEVYYLKALALAEDNLTVRFKLADLYLKTNDTAEAEKYLLDIIKLDKENYDAYKQLYSIYKNAGDTNKILELKEGVTNNRILGIFSDYNAGSATLSVTGGTFTKDVRVSISAKKDIEIYYTLDGTDPRVNGTKYKSTIVISGDGVHTLKVVTKNELGVFSEVMKETYIIEYIVPDDPVVTPGGGVFTTPTTIKIDVPAGCTAYYTWDRTVPTAESEKYVAPFLIPEGYNVLSVVIIDNENGMSSVVYRDIYEYNTSTGAETDEGSDSVEN